MCRCLIVDDTPETYRLNPSNAIPVPMYFGSSSDRVLDGLRDFLMSLPWQGVPLDVRAWPLGPRDAQPLMAAQDEPGRGGIVLGSASANCGRDHRAMASFAALKEALAAPALTSEFSPAFLPAWWPRQRAVS